MTRARVPLRHSLLVRLLATSILVAVAAIVATAWLATRTTTSAIRQEQGRSLTDDKGVYDLLIGYAATHPGWSGVNTLVAQRAAKLGRRITLMTEDRQVIVDSSAGPSLRLARPSATVDPLHLDLGLTGGTERIDARSVGPYRLTAAERGPLRKVVGDQLACLRTNGVDGEIVDSPSGRPSVRITTVDAKDAAGQCLSKYFDKATPTEQKALQQLTILTGRCLGLTDIRDLIILPDFTVYPNKLPGDIRSSDAAGAAKIRSCVEKSRQTQLQPYVAPAALLFVTDPAAPTEQPVLDLSAANTARIAWVTGVVLLAAILVTVLVGRRLVRPLRALTEAAGGSADLHTRVPVSTKDEIGYLARALNDLAERRERAEAQRRAMVSDIAHELRTPLTNIRSWLEAAQDGLARTDAQLVDLLHDEAVLLQRIIDDLGDLAAADAGNLRLHPEHTYLRDLLEQVVDAHRTAAEAAGVRLLTQVAADPAVTADPVRLRQLIGNLVSNAIRYTPPGGAVTVSATPDPAGATISVHDTGVGIAAADLPRVFDRFWRADDSRNRATGGSGLGLAIARDLAEAHGGRLTVDSRQDAGSVFTVWLPTGDAPAPVLPAH